MSTMYARQVLPFSLILCLFVHAIWGLQPTACRYLLVFSEVSFNGQAVIGEKRTRNTVYFNKFRPVSSLTRTATSQPLLA